MPGLLRVDQHSIPLEAPPRLGRLPEGIGRLLTLIGGILWLIVYALAIWYGLRYRSYAIPILAICLNVAWEFRFGVEQPRLHPVPPMPASVRAITLFWLILDAVILLEVFWFGRTEQTIPLVRQFFYVIIPVTLLAAYGMHALMHELFDFNVGDYFGVLTAYLNNLVMSALFLAMFFARPDFRGLAVAIGVFKLFGTTLTSIGLILQETDPPPNLMSRSDPTALTSEKVRPWDRYLLHFLYAAVFLLDVTYVLLFLLKTPEGT
jgi:hypothetical protein